MKWVVGSESTHYLVDDGHKRYIVLTYSSGMWIWRRYGVAVHPGGWWHDMPGVRSVDEARAVALAQWRMES